MSTNLPQPPSDWRHNILLPPLLLIIVMLAVPLAAGLFLFIRAPSLTLFGSLLLGSLCLGAILGGIWFVRRRVSGGPGPNLAWPRLQSRPDPTAATVTGGVIDFQDSSGGRPVTLTLEHLDRPLFISGRPGSGKTTILRAIARAAMQPGTERLTHTVTFDANLGLAEYVAYESLRCGRRPIVLELGAQDVITPIQFPRLSLAGDEAAADAIRKSWFSFEAEVPVQLRDSIVHALRLLAAGGYGFDQVLRMLLSDSFRDEVLRQASERLTHHTNTWVRLTASMPRSEWYRKFQSTLARTFQLLENPAARLALSGVGEWSLDCLTNPAQTGRGLDVIVTATGALNDETIYFLFGILLSELTSVLKPRLEGEAGLGSQAEIVILADEIGRYGGAEGLMDLLSRGRNVRTRAAVATHSLVSLAPELQHRIPVVAVNRVAGGEIGEGARLAAEQLFKFRPDLEKTRGPDGRLTAYWSGEDQEREFRDWLQHAPDHTFAVQLAGQASVLRGQAVADPGLFPPPAELAAALRVAARQSGRPVAEVKAELDRINSELDARFGPIHYQVEPAPSSEATSDWVDRPDENFAPPA